MGSSSVANTTNDEVEAALEKFLAEFNFSKMDETIYRFPAGLRSMFESSSSTYSYIAPRFVAIGPYHKDDKQLEKMEGVKKAATKCFCMLMGLVEQKKLKEQMEASEALKEARGRYVDYNMESKDGHDDAASFAAMMFYDACFLLLYIVAYTISRGKEERYEVHPSMRRFLFSNRDSINNDIMLLENQLPWTVIQALMNAVSPGQKSYLRTAVGKFIARIGNEFKVSVDLDTECYVWDYEENPPPHLLALLRRYKTEPQREPERSDMPPPHDERPLLPISNCFKFKKEETTAPKQTELVDETPEEDHRFPLMLTVSAMELEEIGIKLKGSHTATFSDMDFVPGRLRSELSLAPLSLSNTRASCLINMAAFEVCTASRFGDGHDRTAVCSYLALLDMFMVRVEDVHTLRSKGILHGPQSDEEILTFFKTITKHLPDRGSRVASVMENIDRYRNSRYIWIPLYKWVYNHYAPILQVASFLKLAALLGTLFTIYTAVRSLHKQQQG